MNLPESHLVFIEDLQMQLYKSCGKDPEVLIRGIDSNFANLNEVTFLRERDLTGISREAFSREMAAKYALAHTTKYQDPIISGPFRNILDEVEKAYALFKGEKVAPLLATVPICSLNALAITDQSGSHGIVLQDGVRFWPKILAQFLGGILLHSYDYDQGIELNKSKVKKHVDLFLQADNSLLELFISDAVEGGIMDFNYGGWVDSEISPLSYQSVWLYNFKVGFKFFVLAHEMSHCVNGHVEYACGIRNGITPSMNDSEKVWVCPNGYFEKVRKKAYRKYPEFNNEAIGDAENIRFFQPLENQADVDAFISLLTFLGERKSSPGEAVPILLGAMSFFWFCEITERVQRTLKYGDSWESNSIFTKDFDSQNLLLRDEHPAPLSRMNGIFKILKRSELYSDLKAQWDVLSLVFSLIWDGEKEKVLKAVNDGLDVNEVKWGWGVSCAEFALGIKDIETHLKMRYNR